MASKKPTTIGADMSLHVEALVSLTEPVHCCPEASAFFLSLARGTYPVPRHRFLVVLFGAWPLVSARLTLPTLLVCHCAYSGRGRVPFSTMSS